MVTDPFRLAVIVFVRMLFDLLNILVGNGLYLSRLLSNELDVGISRGRG